MNPNFPDRLLDFDPIVQQYIKLLHTHDSQANGYYDERLGDPRLSRMNVLIKMPVDLWPSVESYDAFRKYYDASFKVLELRRMGVHRSTQQIASTPAEARLTPF
jgi:hypothetical protein